MSTKQFTPYDKFPVDEVRFTSKKAVRLTKAPESAQPVKSHGCEATRPKAPLLRAAGTCSTHNAALC